MTTFDPLYCFLDTDTLIHFQTFDEADWPRHLGARAVQLMLAPSVLREIDKFKDDHTNDRRRQRVRALWSKLARLLDSVPPGEAASVRQGVSIAAVTAEPGGDWRALGLAPNVQDDRLIAAVLAFGTGQPAASVTLVSHDLGVRLKARAHAIPVHDPALRRLKKQVQELSARLPEVKVGFLQDGARVEHVRLVKQPDCEGWRTNEQIEEELELERRACLRLVDPRAALLTTEQMEQYRTRISYYINKLREYLIKDRAAAQAWRYDLDFVLENTGSATATEIEADLVFPDDALVICSGDVANPYFGLAEVTRPKRPTPPRPPTMRDHTAAAWLNSVVLPPPTLPPTPPEPKTWAEDNLVMLRHPKLKAKDEWTSASVAVFLPPTKRDGLEIRCIVHADELTGPREGKLRIVLADG